MSKNEIIRPQKVPTGNSPTATTVNSSFIPSIPQRPSASHLKDPSELKNFITAQFNLLSGSDSNFTISKTYSTIAQGIRFRLDRQKGSIKTVFIPISAKGGLMRPGLLECSGRQKNNMVIRNLLTGLPALTMVEDAKTRTWKVSNAESGNSFVGLVKLVQEKDILTFSFIWNGELQSSISVKVPPRKTGFCSGAKPAALHDLKFVGKFPKENLVFEDNPNADIQKDDFELNAIYKDGQAPSLLGILSLIALLQAMAVELY